MLDLCRFAPPWVAAQVATVHDGGVLGPAFRQARVPVVSAGRRRGHLGLRALARLHGLVRQADVVHTHLWAGDTWGRLAAVLARHRAVLTTVHNTDSEGAWRRAVDRALVPSCRAVICVSEEVAALARAGGVRADRIVVIPNGIDLERFPALPPAAGPARRVLAVGRLTRQKGFDVLLRAVAELPEVEVDIVGEGEDRPSLLSLARPLGARVRLHGWQADLAPFLGRAHLTVVPSRWEGFGLVALEAMASGLPVVASAVDALPGLLGDAGLLVPPEDPQALAGALAGLLSDERQRALLRQRGLRRVVAWDVRQVALRVALVHRALADGHAGV